MFSQSFTHGSVLVAHRLHNNVSLINLKVISNLKDF